MNVLSQESRSRNMRGVAVEVEAVLVELSRRVEGKLGSFGVAGHVEAVDRALVLTGHGPRVQIDVDAEAELFRDSSESQRRLLVERIARELASRRRALTSLTGRHSAWFEWFRLALVAGATLGGLYVAWRWLGHPAQRAMHALTTSTTRVGRVNDEGATALSISSRSVPNTGNTPAERCNAVRTRVTHGGSVSPLDVDGWVVELMLLAPDADLGPNSAALAPFLRALTTGTSWAVVWDESPTLHVAGPDTAVELVAEPLARVIPQTQSGIRVVFTGKYVPLYFEEETRRVFTRFAAALYEATRSNYGALYARCADGRTHHLGSWFRGADWAKVSLSLVASMGLYADSAHLSGLVTNDAPSSQRRVLSRFLDGAKAFDRTRLTMLLADDGGMLAARPGSWATFSYPFADGNRATRSSLRLAQALGLAPKR